MPITDWARFALPADAHCRLLRLAMHGGRDQIAATIAREGWEAFERPLPLSLYQVARHFPGLVIDVGANTGFYSLLAAAAHGSNRVLAFEPVPEVLASLDENMRANRFGDRVRLIRCALGSSNGTAPLYLPARDHGFIETSASVLADFKPAHSTAIAVLQRTLDRVLLRPFLFFQRVSIIKIDVEGYDAAVLQGAYWSIARHRPILFIEILRRAESAALNRILGRLRYSDIRLPAVGAPFVAGQVAFDPSALNHAFVPIERVEAFLALHA